jgi:hypothetical protein
MFELSELTREEKLLVWMKRNQESFVTIAKKMHLTRRSIVYLLTSETISPIRHAQLIKIGLPESLLPPPVYKKPGRSPRMSN